MRKRIVGKKIGRNCYRYTLPSGDPESTRGWTPIEKLLLITLRRVASERGTTDFVLSDGELAAKMDAVLTAATAALAPTVS